MIKNNASHNPFLSFVTFRPKSSRKSFCSEEKLSLKTRLIRLGTLESYSAKKSEAVCSKKIVLQNNFHKSV